MSKVIASYLVKLTLREPDDLPEGTLTFGPPTIERLEALIEECVDQINGTERSADGPHWFKVSASAERTDI